MTLISIDHDRFRRVDPELFMRRVVADCMNHSCRLMAEHGRVRLDACCQYGVDADAAERDAIEGRRAEIAALLRPEAAGAGWFGGETVDADFPSGKTVRIQRFAGGCVFLAHDRRGCAIHRAALEGGWDFHGVKPAVCRLFPMTYEGDALVLSDDYVDYSCAHDPNAPTVYRATRATLAALFGDALVAVLDRAEAAVLHRPLRVIQLARARDDQAGAGGVGQQGAPLVDQAALRGGQRATPVDDAPLGD